MAEGVFDSSRTVDSGAFPRMGRASDFDGEGGISPEGPLSEQDAEAYVASTCFKTGPPGQVGAELEWHVLDLADPTAPVDPRRLTTTFHRYLAGGDRLPAGGVLTREPGGQLELSSRPAQSLAHCLADTTTDVATLRARLASHGLALLGTGADPLRPARRVLEMPRYVAMEEFFDRSGPDGRTMMCSTAAVQVCLDAGADDASSAGFRRRWMLAHLLGPVLVATFANSPVVAGRTAGWRSARQRVWGRLDPRRTRPVWGHVAGTDKPNGAPVGAPDSDPRAEWSRYALDAEVLCVRSERRRWEVPAGLTFRQWLRSGSPRPPTFDDLVYHLTTLFPPVRPRGWVELRMIDAQPGDGWLVPVAVTAALMEDPVAADRALAAVEEVWCPGRGSPWDRAARAALTDPSLAEAARACFAAALDSLPRLGVPEPMRAVVAAYYTRYVERGRTPADDLLDAWKRGEYPTGKELVPC